MAIEHRESENLLRDGVVYNPRLLMRGECIGRRAAEVFFGFRPRGGWSLYCDEDPVLQFTPDGLLRRLYHEKKKYAAVNGRLVELCRTEVGGRVKMQHVALDEQRHHDLLASCSALLLELRAAIQSSQLRAKGFYPDQADIAAEQVTEQLVARAVVSIEQVLRALSGGGLAVASQAGASQ